MARGGGGGGRGGGFRGGGFRGVSRGGGHAVHHHYRPGGPHRQEEGCLGSVLFLPIVLFLLLITLTGNTTTGSYNDQDIEDYASTQYNKAFLGTESYEDNLLLTFVVWDDRSDYSYIAWVGDHIKNQTYNLLGGNSTVLGLTLDRYVQYGYEDTLSDDLSRAVTALAGEIAQASPDGSYLCQEDRSLTQSGLVNNSELVLDEAILTEALYAFTEQTGIPIVLVVEDAEDVFG